MSLRQLTRREVPADWTAQLADLSPRGLESTWLRLRWEEGYPWESPVDRFMIDQMVPEHAVEFHILEQLQHELPPSKMGNYFDSVLGEFIRNADCLITERAWHTYRETGCWARPFWVIQGTTGGHKRWFSNVEKQFLKLAGLPMDPPIPGDLPYADFDNRTMAQLRKHDMLLGLQGTVSRKAALLGGVKDERTMKEERRLRVELVKWLADQVTETADGVMESLMVLDAPRADGFDVAAAEEQSERAVYNYIEYGNSHDGMKID